jgi:hypothetical protein
MANRLHNGACSFGSTAIRFALLARAESFVSEPEELPDQTLHVIDPFEAATTYNAHGGPLLLLSAAVAP